MPIKKVLSLGVFGPCQDDTDFGVRVPVVWNWWSRRQWSEGTDAWARVEVFSAQMSIVEYLFTRMRSRSWGIFGIWWIPWMTSQRKWPSPFVRTNQSSSWRSPWMSSSNSVIRSSSAKRWWTLSSDKSRGFPYICNIFCAVVHFSTKRVWEYGELALPPFPQGHLRLLIHWAWYHCQKSWTCGIQNFDHVVGQTRK